MVDSLKENYFHQMNPNVKSSYAFLKEYNVELFDGRIS